jgi:hypothetical protein
VTLVEKAKLGGDCTWTGCVPSKALVSAARAAHAVRTAGTFGIGPTIAGAITDTAVAGAAPVAVNWAVLTARLKRTIQHIYDEDDSPEALAKLGISVVSAGRIETHSAFRERREETERERERERERQRHSYTTAFTLYFKPPAFPLAHQARIPPRGQVAGSAAFTDANTLSVCVDAATGLRRELTAKYGFVLATGAQPSLPTANIVGLADTPFVT